jgi:hypothetical protein
MGLVSIYLRGLFTSSFPLPECSFHMGYKRVLVNVSTTCGKTWVETNLFVSE